jgi:isocitrate dehydrogenase
MVSKVREKEYLPHMEHKVEMALDEVYGDKGVQWYYVAAGSEEFKTIDTEFRRSMPDRTISSVQRV